ncbi:MAG TPA: glycoside hydrolase family 15 protein [Longimicrobiales bacterium]|nr:glycoside hydrolase family 15 protein [Longimicrobiales bacterium]
MIRAAPERTGQPAAETSGARYPPIADYAVIGDSRTAALVSRHGSLDWLCLPRFDSPSVFAALLDRERGGHFSIRPTGRFDAERRYIGQSNVLETTFRTAAGLLRLRDLMPVASEEEKRRELWPNHQVLRVLDCIEGDVEVEIVCDPRPDYATTIPPIVGRGRFGFQFGTGAPALRLRSELPLDRRGGLQGLGGRFTLRAGERRHLSLTFNLEEPAVVPPFGDVAERKIRQSLDWWHRWADGCRYDGPYRDEVIRSALTLKLMTYAPSGAVLAAPTTSLPEEIGGGRNWDYRYCWVRDASLTLRALFDLGYETEGEAFLSWLLDATRLTAPEIKVMYDLHGETRLTERELDHLEGYAGSRPVRIGNGAGEQLQLDTYGEAVDAAFQFVIRGGRLDGDTGRLLVGLGKTVCTRWTEPDEGIWEIRSGPRHHTHSRVLCWVALDRLIRLHEDGHLRAPVDRFKQERDAIRAEVEARGFNRELGSYVSVLDGDRVDASLLLLSLYGYAGSSEERMRGTCELIYDRLGTGPLLHRYAEPDGLPPGEGAFGIAGFWGVEARARQGDLARATADFEVLCSYANDVGLFAEEIDPETGACLGNFPQAFTHVGLISAAIALAEAAT